MLSGMRALCGLALSAVTGRAASAGAGKRDTGGVGRLFSGNAPEQAVGEREVGDVVKAGWRGRGGTPTRVPASLPRQRTPRHTDGDGPTARSRSGRRPRPAPIHARRAGAGAGAGGGVGTSAWRVCGWFAHDGCAVGRAGDAGVSANEAWGAAGGEPEAEGGGAAVALYDMRRDGGGGGVCG